MYMHIMNKVNCRLKVNCMKQKFAKTFQLHDSSSGVSKVDIIVSQFTIKITSSYICYYMHEFINYLNKEAKLTQDERKEILKVRK